jgi:hypothetical protein
MKSKTKKQLKKLVRRSKPIQAIVLFKPIGTKKEYLVEAAIRHYGLHTKVTPRKKEAMKCKTKSMAQRILNLMGLTNFGFRFMPIYR